MITKHQSWEFINKGYESLYEKGWKISAMIELVNYISSKYSGRLYAFTSLDTLIISLYHDIDRLSEALHIRFDQSSQKFFFSYYGGHSRAKQPEWQREYESSDGITKFDKFIKMIKW